MANDGISISETNPHYWEYDGEPTLLLGGSVEDNLFQIDGLDAHLDTLVDAGGNYVRCTMSSRDDGDEYPYAQVDGEYDLEQWNDTYWERFEALLSATAQRDVVVQVELWATYDLTRTWEDNPFNPANNGTYTVEASGLPEEITTHQRRRENPFFETVPALDDNDLVRTYQQAFADRVLSATLQYDHVLYCIDNETDTYPEWGKYWARFITEWADERDTTVSVTEMWNPWELHHPRHGHTVDRPDVYDYVDVSQNNFQQGETHWDNAQSLRTRVERTKPRPLNNVKVYGADDCWDGFGDDRDAVERFWRNVFGGLASARFHRPPYGHGLTELAQRMIRNVRDVTDAFDLFACSPRNDLLADRNHNVLSGAHEEPEHEAYLLANPGREYAAYFPKGGRVEIEREHENHLEFEIEWYDVDDGEWAETETATTDGEIPLSTPGSGQWAAVVTV